MPAPDPLSRHLGADHGRRARRARGDRRRLRRRGRDRRGPLRCRNRSGQARHACEARDLHDRDRHQHEPRIRRLGRRPRCRAARGARRCSWSASTARPYALELGAASLRAFTVPKLDAGRREGPAFLKLALSGRAPAPPSRRCPRTAGGARRCRSPRVGLPVRRAVACRRELVGPWTAELAAPEAGVGSARDYSAHASSRPSSACWRCASPRRTRSRRFDPWLQSFLVDGKSAQQDERRAMLQLGDSRGGLQLDVRPAPARPVATSPRAPTAPARTRSTWSAWRSACAEAAPAAARRGTAAGPRPG